MGFPCGSAGKEFACNMGIPPGLGRSPLEGKGYPLQYSGLENSIVHGVAESRHDWVIFTFTFFLCFQMWSKFSFHNEHTYLHSYKIQCISTWEKEVGGKNLVLMKTIKFLNFTYYSSVHLTMYFAIESQVIFLLSKHSNHFLDGWSSSSFRKTWQPRSAAAETPSLAPIRDLSLGNCQKTDAQQCQMYHHMYHQKDRKEDKGREITKGRKTYVLSCRNPCRDWKLEN